MDAKTQLAIGAGAKASDIMGLIKGAGRVSAKAMAQQSKVTTSQLELLWKQQVAKAHPAHMTVWNGKKSQQLRLIYTKLGAETPLIIEAVIKGWGDFTKFAKYEAGAKGDPASPEPWFALAQAEALANWWKQETAPGNGQGTDNSLSKFMAEKGLLEAGVPQSPGVVVHETSTKSGQTAEELEALFKEVTGG